MCASRRGMLAAAVCAATMAAVAATGAGRSHAQQQDPVATQQPDAGQAPERPQTPTFEAAVNFVRVDVIATDRNGKPILDLKPEDFEIFEAGRAQKIDAFKIVSLDGGLLTARQETPRAIRSDQIERSEAARDDVRLSAIFLDDYHVKRSSSLMMREQLARAMQTQLGPTDQIGLMYPLQPIADLRLTRDHDAVRRGLLAFEGRKYDYWPANELEERYVFRTDVSADDIERIRNQASFGALKSLITHLGSLKEWRKTIILVSEGYVSTLPRRMGAYRGGLGEAPFSDGDSGSLTSRDPAPATLVSAEIMAHLRELSDLANRNNVSIYPIDPRGLALSEFGGDLPAVDRAVDRMYLTLTTETLKGLAEETDGRALVNLNDVTLAMKQIVVDASSYYLLGYSSNPIVHDGKFHEIVVKVKRPGVDVRHRKGYWALTGEQASRVRRGISPAPPSAVRTAVAAASPRGRAVRTWVGTERGDDGKVRVTFVWEPVPGVPGAAVREPLALVRVSAAGADGARYFGGVSSPTGVEPGAGSNRVAFECPP